ncbi:TniB family NTP-binding protein [Herminiimonas glaciei]|uniref:TniB family NTP-binding protein n=1 Tax=Herminiimonas glaciei TaxID=523788 RepID=A0ABW2I655_9BURK
MKELCRRYPKFGTPNGFQHPVLYVHLVERAKLIDVYIGVLRALGDPAHRIGTEKELRYRTRDLLAAAGVKLLIFDEPHHLTEARSDGARLGLTQLGKSLIDDGLCVVFSGVKSVDDLVAESDELARRFRGKLILGPYRASNKTDIEILRTFCNVLGGRLKFVDPIALGTENVWFGRLLAASNGLVGVISQIVRQAESRARQAGDSQLKMKHFSMAWKNFSRSGEERLQHLKSVEGTRLIDVFAADDKTMMDIVGRLQHKG